MTRNLLRTRRAQGDHGAVLVVVAITMTALVSMAAFAVNLGSISLKRRDLQADADAIALDLGRSLDGRATTAYAGAADWLAEIAASRNRNNFPASGTETDGIRDLLVEPGCFVQATYTVDTTCAVADAVKVTATDDVSEFFRFTNGTTSRSAIGRAGDEPIAGFSIGSFALSVDSTNSPDLNALVGDVFNVGALSYEGLATSNIDLPLLATELGLATPEALFSGTFDVADIIQATADVLVIQGDTANATLLQQTLLTLPPLPPVSFLDILSVAPGGEEAALLAGINALDLVAGTAFVANGANALSIPNLNVGVPGLANTFASVQLIEGARTHYGPVGTGTSTQQLTVTLTTTGNVGLGFLRPVAAVDVTLSLTSGSANALIDRILCGSPEELDIGVVTALLTESLVIGIDLPLLPRIPLTAVLNAPAGSDIANFVLPPDLFGVPQEVGSGSIGLGGLSVTGGGLLGALLAPVLGVIVNPLIAQLDTVLLGPLTDLLGVNVAGADVAALDIICGTNGSPLLVG